MDLDQIIIFCCRETQDTEPSFVICEDLLPSGRMSFKNFNPAVDVSSVFVSDCFKDSCRFFSNDTLIQLARYTESCKGQTIVEIHGRQQFEKERLSLTLNFDCWVCRQVLSQGENQLNEATFSNLDTHQVF